MGVYVCVHYVCNEQGKSDCNFKCSFNLLCGGEMKGTYLIWRGYIAAYLPRLGRESELGRSLLC